jgi:hypothetical protein
MQTGRKESYHSVAWEGRGIKSRLIEIRYTKMALIRAVIRLLLFFMEGELNKQSKDLSVQQYYVNTG